MTDYYVRSTDGNNADSGLTWALAKATIAGACAVASAGDRIFVSQSHAESASGPTSITPGNSRAAPTQIICGNDAAEPPTALATSATVTTTTTGTLSFNGYMYVYGISFRTSVGGGFITFGSSGTSSIQVHDTCEFQLTANNGANRINTTAQAGQYCEWRNCWIKFANSGQRISTLTAGGVFRWIGGGALSGTTSPTILFQPGSVGNNTVLMEDLDLSNFGTGFDIFDPVSGTQFIATIRNSKLPASWAGDLVTSITDATNWRVSMYNCASDTANYRLWIESYAGTIKDETTLIRSGGASDGVTGISWKMVSGSGTVYPTHVLQSDEILYWNNNTGASVTATIHILRDSATNLTDGEIWVEVNYLGNASQPNGTLITDAKADVLATAADQASSSETWTTTGMANPNKQKLAVTFTPNMRGWIIARVFLAKPSTTVYVCPKLDIV